MKSDRRANVAAISIIAGGVGVVFGHYYGGSPGDPEGWFSAVGFSAPFIGAGGMTLVGMLRRRAGLALMAAVAVMPMAMLSIVLIPLIVPSIVLVVQASSAEVKRSDLALGALLAFLLVGTMAVLVLHQDPAEWSTPDGGGSSSNIVTTREAGLAIGAAVTVNLIAALTQVDSRQSVDHAQDRRPDAYPTAAWQTRACPRPRDVD